MHLTNIKYISNKYIIFNFISKIKNKKYTDFI